MLSRLLVVLGLVGVVAGGAAADPRPVTFSQHVAPLLQQHCQECHRPGGGAPFSLANSSLNPRNPNKPPRDVYWGERTVDEMGHAAILYTLDDGKLK